jgi:hypothetical protein
MYSCLIGYRFVLIGETQFEERVALSISKQV